MILRRGSAALGALAGCLVIIIMLAALWLILQPRRIANEPLRGLPPAPSAPRRDVAGAPAPASRAAVVATPRLETTPALPSARVFAMRRQAPVSPGFEGCPANGDGGDPDMNALKNRSDTAAWQPVPIDTVLALPWPATTQRRHRERWSRDEMRDVARYEGVPISIEGYLAGGKQSGPESTNCHGADAGFRDWHVWLSPMPGRDRSNSIVVEPTPASRALHPYWTLNRIGHLSQRGELVRISGWLFYDPEHPEQLGKTRGTLWEIHPVMRIEVRRNGQWVPLDAAESGR
ncbi:MAG: hypothetical protein JWO05_1178 [Gemmatimonadetes bacterium]|nr:hypothetical protein [Gemmatimonadota bacterium]